MTRLIAYLVVIAGVLYVAQAIAPLLILAAVGLVLLAWKRPSTLEPVVAWPRLTPVPEAARATPMRLAGSVAFAVFGLVAIATPIAAVFRSDDPGSSPAAATQESPVAAAEATASPRLTPRPTRQPTAPPARQPTPRPTARPAATPEPTPVFGQEPTGPTQLATVVSVTDGDTIRVLIDGQEFPVRYIGIDTPEVSSDVEWMGREATDANVALVAGREVVLEKDVSETDRYDRLLRYVWIQEPDGWLLVNLELLRQGFAQVSTYPPDVKYIDALYLDAEREARDAALGLWGTPPTPVPTPAAPPAAVPPPSNCEPSYPGICIPIGSADLDCGEIQARRFEVRWDVPNPDPHRFDGDGDGIGCES